MCLAAEYRQVHKKKRKKGSAKIYNNLRNFSLQPNMLSLKSIEIPTRRIHHTNSKPKQQRTNKATEHKQVVHTDTLPTHTHTHAHPLTTKRKSDSWRFNGKMRLNCEVNQFNERTRKQTDRQTINNDAKKKLHKINESFE